MKSGYINEKKWKGDTHTAHCRWGGAESGDNFWNLLNEPEIPGKFSREQTFENFVFTRWRARNSSRSIKHFKKVSSMVILHGESRSEPACNNWFSNKELLCEWIRNLEASSLLETAISSEFRSELTFENC